MNDMSENMQELCIHYILETGNTEVLEHLRKEHFTDPDLQDIIDALHKHYKTFNEIPSKRILLEYDDSDDWYDACAIFFDTLESPEFVATKLNTFIRQRHMRVALEKLLPRIQDNEDISEDLLIEAEKIASIDVGNTKMDGDFIAEAEIMIPKHSGHPCFIEALNAMTSAGGFYSPQLTIFLKGPKTFGTGLLINLAVNYAFAGLKVFYADFENGQDDMRTRLQQCICEATEDDLEDSETKERYKDMKEIINEAGGDVYVKSYKPRKNTLVDIEREIDRMIKVRKWIPDVLFIDYMDIVGRLNKYDNERRHIIQSNYLKTVELNQKYGCFAFSISKVKQSAYEKDQFDIGDFGEDAEKAYNAHAVFAYMAGTKDHELGRARIAPVVQRKGKSYGRDDCYLETIWEKQLIVEIEPGIR